MDVNLTIGSRTSKWGMYVASTPDQCLLGLDCLSHHRVNIKLRTDSFEIMDEEVLAILQRTTSCTDVSQESLKEHTAIPLNTVMLRCFKRKRTKH